MKYGHPTTTTEAAAAYTDNEKIREAADAFARESHLFDPKSIDPRAELAISLRFATDASEMYAVIQSFLLAHVGDVICTTDEQTDEMMDVYMREISQMYESGTWPSPTREWFIPGMFSGYHFEERRITICDNHYRVVSFTVQQPGPNGPTEYFIFKL